MVQVHRRAGGKHFNILGFFGCAFRCKHSPQCTGRCMHKHHIQNGFGDEEHSESQTEAMSQSRLMEASQALLLMQVQEGEDGLSKLAYHRHKPIKLVLPEGSSKTHAAPERPSKTGSAADADQDAVTLDSESNKSNDFSINEFFHCAYGCKHKVHCEKHCMNSHGVVE
jgi:hypothetical protein